MLEPKKIKRRKQHRRRSAFKGKAQRGNDFAFGTVGLKAVDAGELTARQIESGRRACVHHLQRKGELYIRVFPHTPVTKKAAEVPMGSGKGTPEYYATVVKPGTMVYELAGVDEESARESLRLAGHKLPFKWKIVVRDAL